MEFKVSSPYYYSLSTESNTVESSSLSSVVSLAAYGKKQIENVCSEWQLSEITVSGF